MAHQQQFDFIQLLKTKYPSHFANAKVLEVGSLNINGSIRQFFTDCDYLGIDVGPGLDVDLVCEGQKLYHPNEIFAHLVSDYIILNKIYTDCWNSYTFYNTLNVFI
jgi:hypothetical protein